MGKVAVIVSDLHLGRGDELEDFVTTNESAFVEFLHHHSKLFRNRPTDLVLLGDFLDIWQVASEDDKHATASEEISLSFSVEEEIKRLRQIINAHPLTFNALNNFLVADLTNRRIVCIPGNHDHSLVHEEIQSIVHDAIVKENQSLKNKVVFLPYYDEPELRTYAEHGNQFDLNNDYEKFSEFGDESAGYYFVRLFWNRLELLEPNADIWSRSFEAILKNRLWHLIGPAFRLYRQYFFDSRDFERIGIPGPPRLLAERADERVSAKDSGLSQFPDVLFSDLRHPERVFSMDDATENHLRSLYHDPSSAEFKKEVDKILNDKYQGHPPIVPEQVVGAERFFGLLPDRYVTAAEGMFAPDGELPETKFLRGTALSRDFYQYVVMGHTHEDKDETLGDSNVKYFNTGSWSVRKDAKGRNKSRLCFVLVQKELDGSVRAKRDLWPFQPDVGIARNLWARTTWDKESSQTNVPPSIARAARERFESARSIEQRERVYESIARGRPLEAEPNPARRIDRMKAVTGLPPTTAEMLAEYRMDASTLDGLPNKGIAEAIQGSTTDFLDVVFLEIARFAANTVARIIFRDGRPQGTGFLISDKLLITNNHVIESADAASDFLVELDYEIDGARQPRLVTRFQLAPEIFFETDDKDDFDYTVVAVGSRVSGEGLLAHYGFLPLRDTPDRHSLAEFVNVIQHPNGEYKKIALHENRLVSRLDNVLHYITDTLPGSSGSPVLNLQCEPVALHHWGGPHRQVTYPDGRPVDQYANEGIRISAIVRELRQRMQNMAPDRRALLEAALDYSGDPFERKGAIVPKPLSLGDSQDSIPQTSTMGPRLEPDGTVRWSTSIPIHIWARIGSDIPEIPLTSHSGTTPVKPAIDREKVIIDTDYSNRNGYNPSFLSGFKIPLPDLSEEQKEIAAKVKSATGEDDPHELKYQHFSIVMNGKRRMAFFTACNIDGSTWIHIDRETGDPKESAEAREMWFQEPRIDKAQQCNDRDHYQDQSFRAFDRGHLVRRQDPSWGTPMRAKRANADTFHFSNCTPQHFTFNQKTKYWLGIENYILDNAKAEKEKIVVFTGPVLDKNDPQYRDIQIPRLFWKILVRVENGRLLATALKADQSDLIKRMPERFGEIPAALEEFQTSVTDIERLTGLDFGILRYHDTFVAEREEAIGGGRVLRSFADLQLG
jgi:endonuclease G